MARRTTKAARAAASLGAGLMLAPAVVAMRMPVLLREAGGGAWPAESIRAMSEKSAAMAEGAVAAQMSLAVSASRFWLEVMSGRTPSLFSGEAMDRAVHAALAPAGKAVRGNYGRLSRRPR